MKSEVKQAENKSEKPFPKLMISRVNGAVVLFTSSQCGICLNDANDEQKGIYCDDWVMSIFTDFDGTVTLSND